MLVFPFFWPSSVFLSTHSNLCWFYLTLNVQGCVQCSIWSSSNIFRFLLTVIFVIHHRFATVFSHICKILVCLYMSPAACFHHFSQVLSLKQIFIEWFEGTFKGHLVQFSLSWMSSTRSGCSGSCPIWSLTFVGIWNIYKLFLSYHSVLSNTFYS